MRMIDADALVDKLEQIISDYISHGMYPSDFDIRYAIDMVEDMPTLTPQNELLTLDQLRKMDGEPVYIISEFYHISEWNIPNGIGEIVIAYDVPCAGMKSIIPSVEFIDGKNLSVEKYGSDWVAYRRPPE